ATNVAGIGGVSFSVPVLVVVPPTNRTVAAGADATFQVTAYGPAPLRYQWRFNGADILDATNALLSITHVTSAHRGLYTAVVSNSTNTPGFFPAALNVLLPDRDGDGIPDEWEDAHSLNADDPSDAVADPDHDTVTNWEEYIAGTDPHDQQSHLRIDAVASPSGSSNGVALTFEAITNRFYTLEGHDILSTSGWFRLRDIEAVGTSNRLIHLYDWAPSNSLQRYYRVIIPQQP